MLPDGSKRVTNKNRLSDVNTSFRKRKRTPDDVNSSKKQLIYFKKDENNSTSIKVMFIVFIVLILCVFYLIITKCKSFCTQSFLDKLDITTINY